jgi:ribosome-binding factor A
MIKKNSSKIRGLIGNNTRHQLRKIPELEFYLDDTLDYVFKMENIFKDIEKERESLNQTNKDEE